ncbi:MAG: hypothetical protein HY561_13475, partial [Gemmatimonadetes bacterium]|nr:hypothetical protein [Gemmatimonadota bacterium]
MMRTIENIYRVVVALMFALGLLHTGLALVVYDHLTAGALWFAGTGLLIMIMAVLNWLVLRTGARDSAVNRIAAAANLVVAAFAGIASLLIQEPQAYALLALFVAGALLPDRLRQAALLERGGANAAPERRIVKVARYRVKATELGTVESAILEFVAAVRRAEAHTVYEAYRQPDGVTFLHFMSFANAGAEQMHRQAPYTLRFVDVLYPRCED